MEPNTIITVVIAVVAIVSVILAIRAANRSNDKVFYVFGWIIVAASIGDLVMGIIIHRWWVCVLSAVLLLVTLFCMFVWNLEEESSLYDDNE